MQSGNALPSLLQFRQATQQPESLLLRLHADPMQKMAQYLRLKDIVVLSFCNRYLWLNINKSTHHIASLQLDDYRKYFDPNLEYPLMLSGVRKFICRGGFDLKSTYPQLFRGRSRYQVSIEIPYGGTFVPSNWSECPSISLELDASGSSASIPNILKSLTNLHQLTILSYNHNIFRPFEGDELMQLFEIVCKAPNLNSLTLVLPTQAFNDPILFEERYRMILTQTDTLSLWNKLTSFSFGTAGLDRVCNGQNCICNMYQLILHHCNLQMLTVNMSNAECAKNLFTNMKKLNFTQLIEFDLNMSIPEPLQLSPYSAILLEHITNSNTNLNKIHLTIYTDEYMTNSFVTALENLLIKCKLRYIEFTLQTRHFNWFSFLNRIFSQKTPSRRELNLKFIVWRNTYLGDELGPLLDTMQQMFYFPVLNFNNLFKDRLDGSWIHRIETTHQWISRVSRIKEDDEWFDYRIRINVRLFVENGDYNLEEGDDEQEVYKLQLRGELNEEKRWKYEVKHHKHLDMDHELLFDLPFHGSIISDDTEYVIASEFDVSFDNYTGFNSVVQLNQ